MKNIKTIIIHIEGGFGKNLACTALTATLKEQYPEKDIIIVTAWDDAWVGNPHVTRVYNFNGLTYFYDDYVKNKSGETLIIRQEPYFQSSYILREKNLVNAWAELIPNTNEVEHYPVVNLSKREIDFTRNQINITDKPIFVIHPCGGGESDLPYSWARDIPPLLTQEIIYRMNQAGYRTIQIGRQNQRQFDGVEMFSSTLRSCMALFTFSEKRLLIDSFSHHACAGFNLPSTVLWIANKPSMLGYNIHNNIVCNKTIREDSTRKSYLEPFNIMGALEEYPYDNEPLFDIDEIMSSLLN